MKGRLIRHVILAAVVISSLACGVPARASDIQFRGLLDLVGSSRGVALESNWFNYGDSNFDAYRLRVFAEGAVTDKVEVYTQALFTDAAPARALGAYVSYAPLPEQDLHLIAGKIPWIIGTYASRTYSNKNPLVSTPLMYQYHMTIRADQLIPSVDALLAQAGRGQYGVNYASVGGSRFRGVSVIYDLCWDFGVAAIGSARPLELAVGATNGTPGRMNAAQDENDGKNYLGRIGLVPLPALRFGISGSVGPYLQEKLNPDLPSGRRAEDYDQRLVMADFELLLNHAEFRSEAYRSFWDTPTVGTLSVNGYYVEGKYTFPLGVYAAARWERMDFGEVTSGAGERRPWDFPRTRTEAGGGYRLSKSTLLKAVYQRFAYEEWEPGETEKYSFNLYAAQLSIAF